MSDVICRCAICGNEDHRYSECWHRDGREVAVFNAAFGNFVVLHTPSSWVSSTFGDFRAEFASATGLPSTSFRFYRGANLIDAQDASLCHTLGIIPGVDDLTAVPAPALESQLRGITLCTTLQHWAQDVACCVAANAA